MLLLLLCLCYELLCWWCEAWVSPVCFVFLFVCLHIMRSIVDFALVLKQIISQYRCRERMHMYVFSFFLSFIFFTMIVHNAHTQWISSHHRNLHSCYLFIHSFFSVFIFKYELIDIFHIKCRLYSHNLFSFVFVFVSLSVRLRFSILFMLTNQQKLVIISKSISPGEKSAHIDDEKKNNRRTEPNSIE